MKTVDELREETHEAYEEVESEMLRISKLVKNGEEVFTIPVSHFDLAQELALSTHRCVEDVIIHSLVEYAKTVWPDADLSAY